MTYPFEIEKVPAFLGTKKITHLYQDQYDHIVNPVMEVAEKAFNGEVDSRMGRVFCPPGSGKTILGLYVWSDLVRRPALILSPNSAIQAQWVARTSLFDLDGKSDQVGFEIFDAE